VAVLAHSTSNVGLLVAQLDLLGVPWSVRGGSLFLADPLHRQFLLGLRGIADRDDGVAQAALLRPPFFDVTLADLARARAAGAADTDDEGILRARAARALVEELRRERHARPPGGTARDLLDRTAFARVVAFGPNGAQRLERLRELCLEVERIAAEEGLDFDAVTLRLRDWALEPAQLDPPRPVGGDAVQVMTIHQAKGLEFPIVAWWDGHAKLAPRKRSTAWLVSRTGDAWAIAIDGVAWEEPRTSGLAGREEAWLAAERRRLVYVAGTRARDLLVLPVAAGLEEGSITRALLGPQDGPAVELLEASVDPRMAPWAAEVEPPAPRRPRNAPALAGRTATAWREAASASGRRLHVPTGVSTEAHRIVEAEREGDAGRWTKAREGRFGRLFGDTVHEAIGVALRAPALAAAEAVARAARVSGLDRNHAEAAEDMARALEALGRERLRAPPGESLRLEYPVGLGKDGTLLVGYVDLLAVRDGEVIVLDFKTDAPPQGDVAATYPEYVEQVRSYGRILVALGLAAEGKVRAGLLFTADGVVRWV
jgi:ATP-dependent helicase/nuclease subunit A